MRDRIIDTAEAAALLSVAPGTLRTWRHLGMGPKSFKLGARIVRYREEDVLAWIQNQYGQHD